MATAENTGDKPPVNVIYARKSTAIQNINQTCKAQIETCRKYLKHLGMDPGTFIADTDDGGYDRAGMKQVMDLSESRQLGTLIAVSLDRFGRSDAVMDFIRDVVFRGGHVMTVAESFSTNEADWASLARLRS